MTTVLSSGVEVTDFIRLEGGRPRLGHAESSDTGPSLHHASTEH